MIKNLLGRAASIVVACAALTVPAGLVGATGIASPHTGVTSVASIDPVPCDGDGPIANGASPAGDSADGCDGERPV
jgi:hypothetical protein